MDAAAAPAMALVHSPFLDPFCWAAVESVLVGQGRAARRLDLRDGLLAGIGFYEAFGRIAARQLSGPSVLVVHSGAGALVPMIARHGGGTVRGAVFVDALLPHPGRSWFDTAPRALVERLRAKSVDGLAPPWPQWAPPGSLRQLLPDTFVRARVEQGSAPIPLAFLEERAPRPDLSGQLPCGFLQLSPGYDTEATQAAADDWPVARISGHHLSLVTDPDAVSTEIVRLVECLRGRPTSR
jgi:hypothetical protein